MAGEVDPLGNLTSSPKYDVYGATRSNGGTATSKQGFVGSLGHVSDDTGLIYMRARYYDPSAGRFVSEDSSQDGSNWFAYADNNPINNVDRTGKGSQPADEDLYNGLMLAFACIIFSGAVLAAQGGITFYKGELNFMSGRAEPEIVGPILMAQGLRMMARGALSILGGLGLIIAGGMAMREVSYILLLADVDEDDGAKVLT